jgi:hypothetical protein
MKKNVAVLLVAAVSAACWGEVRPVRVDWSPYPFTVGEFVPTASRVVSIVEYGAKADGSKSTEAINRAITECSEAGGGRVLVPSGVWTTGALELKSDVELHLAEGATLAFTEGPVDYPLLPSPKGYDEQNGRRPAPFVRANGVTNVAITGRGELRGNVKYWFRKDRLGHSRPGFIWFDSCRNVLLKDVKIRQSAFWTIHMRLCTDVVLRGLDVECLRDIAPSYTNTDGVDIDSSTRVLIEDCRFNQDDDVICMKSGKNETGRKLGVPTENVAVRNCVAVRGHGLLSCGSELSGGIRNIYMTDCHVAGCVNRILRVKTNRARGGFVRDVTVERISARKVDREVFMLETEYPERGGVKEPYFFTEISDITFRDIRCDEAPNGISICGFVECPAKNIRIENVRVAKVRRKLIARQENVENLVIRDVRVGGADGWADEKHDRRILPTRKTLWCAPIEEGIDAFDVELRGAEGAVTVEDGALRIVKTNDRGLILVRPKEPLAHKHRQRIRVTADVACTDAEPLRSTGRLVIWGKKEDLGLTGLDKKTFGAVGPRVQTLINTPPGTTEAKFCQYEATGDAGTATPVIVVGGVRSESIWKNWLAEDLDDVNRAWDRQERKMRPKDRREEAMETADFEAALERDRDHVAKVVTIDGVPRLFVDGKMTPPVFFKSRNLNFVYDRGRYVFTGQRMEREADVRLQVINLPGARTHNYTNGAWTATGYDAQAAVECVRLAMRISPASLFVLSVPAMPPPVFGGAYPDEVMRTEDGKILYGNESVVYGTAASFADIPSNRWAWLSYSSTAFRTAVGDMLTQLIVELKRTGLARRIVGIHFCGFRDWQFGTPEQLDYSAAARRAYAERGNGVSYVSFLQSEPTHAQNEFARCVKACFGKDIITMRWCISALSGGYGGSFDIGEFVRSDALDILVAQPMYVNRASGVPLGVRLPLGSFRKHGKMFVNEFDLRTDCSLVACGATESDSIGLGLAKGLDAWQTTFRRAAGQMMAQGDGWWFYDMAGGWYESSPIAADIAAVQQAYGRLLDAKACSWHPSLVVLIDEQGALEAIAEKAPHRNFNDFHVLLASAGVPYDQYLATDALNDPRILEGMRVVYWFGFRPDGGARDRLAARLRKNGVRLVLSDELSRLGGRSLHTLARNAGAYVPSETYGLQVDMSGRFMSVHALLPGRYAIHLPFAATVTNLRSGARESVTNDTFTIDLVAGETRWFRLLASGF